MKILVYPCGTEIAFEIYRSLSKVKNIELWGGTSDYNNHGLYVYDNIITDLPFISDLSSMEEMLSFYQVIKEYQFDYIYPAMDGCVLKFAEFRDMFSGIIIAPDSSVAEITRSKLKTYRLLQDCIKVPDLYTSIAEVQQYPVFVKPDIGQGSVGAKKINDQKELIEHLRTNKGLLVMEYLPGDEYTVDCFTNCVGKLVLTCIRKRMQVKNGISVSCDLYYDNKINEIANKINSRIKNIGGWFFQLKKNINGDYVLLEVSSRIAGTSGFTRCLGANLPLLTIYTFQGQCINDIPEIDYGTFHIDRALYNVYKTDLVFDSVYVDYDDTLVINGNLNIQLVTFLFSCVNDHKKIFLLTRHDDDKLGRLDDWLDAFHIRSLFTEIIHIEENAKKTDFITGNAIFIDDSYGERIEVSNNLDIPVFDPSMIEALIPFNHVL